MLSFSFWNHTLAPLSLGSEKRGTFNRIKQDETACRIIALNVTLTLLTKALFIILLSLQREQNVADSI